MGSTGEGNGKPLQYSCLENPMNSMNRQKDMTLTGELPGSVGAQYATGEVEPESEGAVGGSELEAGDSDTEGEDIFTGAAAVVSSHPSGQVGERPERKERLSEGRGGWAERAWQDLALVTVVVAWVLGEHGDGGPWLPHSSADSKK